MRRIALQSFVLLFLGFMSSAASAQSFGPTIHMTTPRQAPASALLKDGTILIVGGENYYGAVEPSAELFQNGGFYPLPRPVYPRENATIVALPAGDALLIGGDDVNRNCISQIEQYQASSAQFNAVATLPAGPCYTGATLLASGKVLILSTSTSLLYDPMAKTYVTAASTNGIPGTIVPLGNGGIFITDGTSAQLFTPASGTTGSFTSAGNLSTARTGFTANLLPSGSVLIAGGCTPNTTNALQSTEIWTPGSGFAPGPQLTTPRCLHSAVTLGDGTVFIAGGRGYGGNGSPFGTGFYELSSTEAYDYSHNQISSGPSLPYQTFSSSATALPGSAGVLFAGGADFNTQGFATNESVIYNYPVSNGSFAPKYIVLGVLYSPPGKGSSVSYNSSQSIGSSNSIKNAFTSTEKIGISLPSNPGVGNIFDAAGNISQSWSQEQDTSSGLSITNTLANTLSATPPLSATIGVDHDYDTILVWVNPQVNLAVGPIQNLVLWQGLQANPKDNLVGDLDVLHFSVYCLKNPYVADCPSLRPRYSRPWDASGLGGLTMADFQDILNADPFAANPNYDPSQDPNHRFDLQPGAGIDYTPEPPGAASSANGYAFTSTRTTTQGQGATDTHQTQIDLSKISILGYKLPFNLTSSNTFQWTNQWSSTETQTLGSMTSVNIFPPVYTDFYPSGQPTQFDVYRDNVYGSYMFYANGFGPQSPGSIVISPSPLQFGSVKGGTTSAAVQVTLSNASTLPITYDSPALNFTDPAFSIVSGSDGCSGSSHPANAVCSISVVYTPSAAQTPITGSTSVSAMMFASGVTDAVVTASTSIGATALPLFITSGPVNFGAIPVQNTSSSVNVTFTNQSNTSISLANPAYTFSDPSFNSGSGADTCSGQTLAPNQSCSVSVQFHAYVPDITTVGNNNIGGNIVLASLNGPVSSVLLQGTAMVTVLGTPSVGSFTISGTEQVYSMTCPDPNNPNNCYPTNFDIGAATLVIVALDANYNATVWFYQGGYGYGSTADDMANEIVWAVNSDPTALITATFGGNGTVNFVSKSSGVATNYIISGAANGNYSPPSFSASFPPTMTGGTDPVY